MPSITGHVMVILTVRDCARSAAWYCDVLGLHQHSHYRDDSDRLAQVNLVHPGSGLGICLVEHAANSGEPFTELRTGLDHLEFLVSSPAELVAWAHRLDELGIGHSGVKAPEYTSNTMITFRDPDNIQLEFFCSAR